MSDVDDLMDALLGTASGSAGEGVDGGAWRRLTESGATRLGLPEELGGAGGDVADAAAAVIRCGQAGLSVPIVESTLLATALANRMQRPLPDGIVTVAVPRRATPLTLTPVGDRVDVRGVVEAVAWGSSADLVLIPVMGPGGPAVWEAPAGSLAVHRGQNLAGDACDTLRVDTQISFSELHTVDTDVLDEIRLLASFGRSCQVVGALRQAVAMTVDYAQTRKQFGRRIGDHQVIQHMVVEAIGETAATEAVVADATLALSERTHGCDCAAEFAVAAARVQAARAAEIVARHAHQIHAAIGIAAEHPLHHFTLRLWSWPFEYGTPRDAAVHLGRRAKARRPWEFITDPSGQ
jgi:acyl-CoA dehydrogenase